MIPISSLMHRSCERARMNLDTCRMFISTTGNPNIHVYESGLYLYIKNMIFIFEIEIYFVNICSCKIKLLFEYVCKVLKQKSQCLHLYCFHYFQFYNILCIIIMMLSDPLIFLETNIRQINLVSYHRLTNGKVMSKGCWPEKLHGHLGIEWHPTKSRLQCWLVLSYLVHVYVDNWLIKWSRIKCAMFYIGINLFHPSWLQQTVWV